MQLHLSTRREHCRNMLVLVRFLATYRSLSSCVTGADVALSARCVESPPGWTWWVQPVDTHYLSTYSRCTLCWTRAVPNRSIQKEVGKTGCEVIKGHSVWAEIVQVATNREKCSYMCTARSAYNWESTGEIPVRGCCFFCFWLNSHVCSGLIMVGKQLGEYGMFSCRTGVISGQWQRRSSLWLGCNWSQSWDDLWGLYHRCGNKNRKDSWWDLKYMFIFTLENYTLIKSLSTFHKLAECSGFYCFHSNCKIIDF